MQPPYPNGINIEKKFGDKLKWRRLSKKTASRICYSKECQLNDKGTWEELHKWNIKYMTKLIEALEEHIQSAKKDLKL